VAVDGSIKISTKIDQSGFTTGRKQLESGLNGIKKSLNGVAVALGLTFGAAVIVNYSKDAVKASTELSNALIGLQSIVEGQGRSFFKAKQFIDEYIKDGLVPATQAINAYKNLALRGYDDSQIQQVLIALKDSAAFGRQASYSLGQAVESATEGLKNENSILVDNAGVTKNVAKMWEEYAESIGTTANNLTKQQKIQAEVLGIMQETRFQTGDATKVANTYSGQLMRLQFNFNNLKVAVGNALIPIAQAVMPSINAMIAGLTRLAYLAAQVTTALFGKQATQQKAVASSGSAAAGAQKELAKATEAAGKAAVKSLAGFDELNVLQKESGAEGVPDGTQQAALPGLPDSVEVPGEVTLSPTVQAVVDKIKSILEPLQKINFDNLKKAFERLKTAISPITQNLFNGLEWAYRNLFVPLATWSMEVHLPALLDNWAASFDVVAATIDALKPLGTWLWETFLKPLAQWTGGTIVRVLESITTALKGVSEWIKDNKEFVEAIATAAGSFALAWGLVNTVMGIWALIGGIATAITTAFGVAIAFLTSPIGLVVIAIGILIAIVVALVKDWDRVKETAINVWNSIVAAWNVAAAWFKGKVVEPIRSFFAGLWSWLTATAQDVWGNVVVAWQGAGAWFDTYVVQPIANFFKGLWDGVKATFTLAWDFMTVAFKGYVNGWITIIEGFINFFIGAINLLIDGLNKISISLPDWDILGDLAGLSWGLNISQVPSVKIPRLATGAVIPPNAEFLAVLGDQKRGTNIEAPLDTIVAAVMTALDKSDLGGGDMMINNILKLDGEVIYQNQQKVARRRGKNLIMGV